MSNTNIESLKSRFDIIDNRVKYVHDYTQEDADELSDIAGQLFDMVVELKNGKTISDLQLQTVILEVENAELKGANILLNEQNDKLRDRIESLTDQLDSVNWRT